jgi:hypothetical protein
MVDGLREHYFRIASDTGAKPRLVICPTSRRFGHLEALHRRRISKHWVGCMPRGIRDFYSKVKRNATTLHYLFMDPGRTQAVDRANKRVR